MKTIKRVILPLFIFLMLVLTIPHDAVVKGAVVTLVNWDDEAQGSRNGTTGVIQYTWDYGDDFEILTDEPTHGSSPHALKIQSNRDNTETGSHENDAGWINLTSNISYIGSIRIEALIQFTTDTTLGEIQMIFYNNSVEVLNIRMQSDSDNAPDRRMLIKDHTGIFQSVYWDNFVNENPNSINFDITHVSTNLINYSWYNTDGTNLHFGWQYTTVDGNDWVTFDSIYVNATHEKAGGSDHFVELNIDDIIIDTEPAGGFYTCDVDGYDTYNNIAGAEGSDGSIGVPFSIGWNTIIELAQPIERDLSIVGFDLQITDSQRSGTDENDYHLYVNGVPVGIPDDMINTDEGWTLRWCGFSVTLADERPIFEVKCDSGWLGSPGTSILSKRYVGYGPLPLTQTYHDNDALFGNGVLDGTALHLWDYIKWSYYSSDVVPYEESGHLQDAVWVNGETFYQYTPVWISWTARNTTTQNRITVYDSSNNLEFAEYVYTAGGSVQWTPTEVDTYTVNLFRTANQSSDTFTVIFDPSGDGIWTSPNPQQKGNTYTVHWNYTHDLSLNGVIYRGYSDDPSEALFIRTIPANTTGNFTTVETTNQEITYWFLGIEQPTFWNLLKVHMHFNIVGFIPSDGLTILYDNIYLDDTCEGDTQYVSFTHRFIGQEVRIYDGNNMIYNSYLYRETFNYPPVGVGFHRLYLYVVDPGNGTEYLLANTSFVAEDSCEEGTWRDVFPLLHPTLGMIVGVIVTGMFTLMPLFFSIGFSKKQIHIPSVAYPMFTCMGVIISVTFGFFQPWVLFFVLAVGIIIITIMYLTQSSNGG